MSWVYIDIEEILKETDRAFLCRVGGEEFWLPKSQFSDPDDYEEGDLDLENVAVTEFIAGKHGLK